MELCDDFGGVLCQRGSGKAAGFVGIAMALDRFTFESGVCGDDEIKTAAGRTISEIFEEYGEAEFRALERRVIARLMTGDPCVRWPPWSRLRPSTVSPGSSNA